MNKIFLSLSLLMTLAACTRPGAEPLTFENLPNGLADCKFYQLTDENGSRVLIARCPNSSVAVHKEPKATVSITVDQPASAVKPFLNEMSLRQFDNSKSKIVDQPASAVKPFFMYEIPASGVPAKYDPLDK